MKSPTVASIPIPIPSMVAYFLYIALGLVIGVLTIFFVGSRFGGQYAFLFGNVLLYAAAVFAHFRFAYGIPSWPALEKGDLGRTVALGLVSAFVGYFAIRFVAGVWLQNLQGFHDGAHLQPETHFRIASRHLERGTALVITGIDGCIVAPIAEEILFRSGVYRILKGRYSASAAAAFSAVLFALSHRSVAASAPIFVLGYLCCWIYEKTADIRGPIIFHAGYNILVFYAALPRYT